MNQPKRHGNTGKVRSQSVADARARSLREPFISQRPSPIATKPWHPKREAWSPLPDTKPVALGAVTGCRWPLGDELPFLFCNATTEGGSYCAAHAELSRPKPQGDPR